MACLAVFCELLLYYCLCFYTGPVAPVNAVSEITVSCQTEFKHYVYNKSEEIWALVTLKAPENEDENKRAPIDVVAVIDKSGSMAGHKLKLVKQTLEFVISQCKISY